MPQAKAIAIAAQQNPFVLAAESVKNLSSLLIDVMYGTRKRSNYTMLAAAALGVAGALLNGAQEMGLFNCLDTL